MHALRADAFCKIRVTGDDEDEAAALGDPRQSLGELHAVLCAVMTKDHARAARQGARDLQRIGHAFLVGEKKQRRKAQTLRVAGVERTGNRG